MGAAAAAPAQVGSAVPPPAHEPSDEEKAKAAWLASLDKEPSWKGGSSVVGVPASAAAGVAAPASTSEAAAKAKWLASLDSQPSWKGRGSGAPTAPVVVHAAAAVGPTAAAPPPAAASTGEAAAKAAWLASLDKEPSWKGVAVPTTAPVAGAAAATGRVVPTAELGSVAEREVAAKAKWLAMVEQGK
ncbi:hypothetical protein EMIHUDRAFT_455889 [Emiliania huxleyi CCMP1516]|uniref:Uncharacterized protein n=2 Tax=Emiliania huxleyi TaxID=2903 RepID=A0A0D3KBC2_EMIH1|nr:hypothetical protein EMIHUDRAFT_455889 [Emiliania huxleyi CCMP1516]EOD33057.1 hypothetical protein EMIHUDRAFT_455889 [Emiliania huxleyi CCMP1516]|eukprot:XP_005785486.1 hypothetical protein EMIHUDRAFT_455889 [Emiliania huxleyi CCMP1516]